MNILRSVGKHGLVAMPPIVDTTDLAWLQRDAAERLLAKNELASIRRELRVAVLARAVGATPRWLQIVERLKRQAEAMPLWYLGLLAILAPLAMIGSATWMVAGASIAKHLLGLVGLALYGTITMQAIYGLTSRLPKYRRSEIRLPVPQSGAGQR